jgi:hypothetical protein
MPMDERRKVVWIKKFTHLGKRPVYACSRCLHRVKKTQKYCFHCWGKLNWEDIM